MFGLLLGHYRAISLHNCYNCFANVLLPAVFCHHSKAVNQIKSEALLIVGVVVQRKVVRIQIRKMPLLKIILGFLMNGK